MRQTANIVVMGGGSWGRLPRRAFDALVRGGAPERALLLYAEAAELGCEFRGAARARASWGCRG